MVGVATLPGGPGTIFVDAGATRCAFCSATAATEVGVVLPTTVLQLTGTFRVRVFGDGGEDQLFFEVTNNGRPTVPYDLALFGGKDDDVAEFLLDNKNGTPTFGPEGAVLVDGDGGTDTLELGGNANVQVVQFEVFV